MSAESPGVGIFGDQTPALNGALILFWVLLIPLLPLSHCILGGVYEVANPFALGARLLRSVGWMLEAAGISTIGLGGIVAVKLTAAAYLATSRVWLRDASPDLAPTMAGLDRRLRGIERWFGGGRRPQSDATASRA